MAADLEAAQAVVRAALPPAGEQPLTPEQAGLIAIGLATVATNLNVDRAKEEIGRSLDLGVSADQVAEVIVMVSAVGFHAMHEGMPLLLGAVSERDGGDPHLAELDPDRRRLWDRAVGPDPYWDRLEEQLPGFLDSMLRLSPRAFSTFFEFCAIPWQGGKVDALTKELIYMSLDVTPTHRYLPGLRLHVDNCVRLGASRRQLIEAMESAAAAGEHQGVG